MNSSCAHPLRCTLVWLAGTAAVALAARVLGADAMALASGPGEDLEQALVRCGSLLLLGCAAWSWLATTVVALQAARGRGALPVRGVPAAWRRLVLLACGATLAAGLAAPSYADPGLAGLPLPDRAAGGPGGPAPATGPAPRTAPGTVTVHAGDSLWELAAADLGNGASPAEVDRHWRALYVLNRPVLGPDPDLIHPGQQLRLPPPPEETS